MPFGNYQGDYPGPGTGQTGFYACHAQPYNNNKKIQIQKQDEKQPTTQELTRPTTEISDIIEINENL